MMHRNTILFFILILYYTIGTYALYSFDAGLLVSTLVLFGVPALVLSHFTLAPPAVLLSVLFLGVGVAILFEGVAHIYGLWYSLGEMQTRLFGLVPIEMLLSTTVQVIFLALLYEVFFDDGVYTPRSAWHRMTFFGVFAFAVTCLLGIQQLFFKGFFLEYAYFWIIGSIIASALATLAMHRDLDVHFFDRIIDFTLVACIPMGIMLWLSATNVHKVFALSNEYISMFSLFGQLVPLEEIILLFALPFFVGTMYEVYLDDRQ